MILKKSFNKIIFPRAAWHHELIQDCLSWGFGGLMIWILQNARVRSCYGVNFFLKIFGKRGGNKKHFWLIWLRWAMLLMALFFFKRGQV
jgi:hypothetical protein